MTVRVLLAVAALLHLAPTSAAEPADTARAESVETWRLGVSMALIRFAPPNGNEPDVWDDEIPAYGWGFYPFLRGMERRLTEGRSPVLLPGLVLRNSAGTEIGLAYGRTSLRYTVDEGSFPASYGSRHWLLRGEYTRSTRPRIVPQRPRFGFRYGCALALGQGSAERYYRWSHPVGRGESRVWMSSTLIRMQPTIQFGYRSSGVNAGLQVYWNLMAYVSGTVRRQGSVRSGGESTHVDEVERANDLVLVDRLAQQGLLWSYFQAYLSAPVVGICRRRPK